MPERTATELSVPEQDRKKFYAMVLNHALVMEGDFIGTYDVVLTKVKDKEMQSKIKEFRADHERHVEDLRNAIKDVGGEAMVQKPKPTPFGEGVAKKLKAIDDEKTILREFLISEELSRTFYEGLTQLDGPEPVVRVINRAYEDEQRHLEWALEQVEKNR